MNRAVLAWLALAGVCSAALPAEACTTFFLGQGSRELVGKSYDWHMDQGLVLVNKAGVKKSALLLDAALAPATWISRYASVTFNQYGWEFPNGGMNAAGLVVEIMVSDAVYPPAGDRPAINELQWIQYQLDRFGSVAEVVANAGDLAIAPIQGDVHYLVCDSNGACAAVEYLDGELAISAGDALPWKTLTNHPYPVAAAYARKFVGLGGAQPIPKGSSSLDRFVRATHLARLAAAQPRDESAYAFQILDSVRVASDTQWNIVYDLSALRVSFRTRAFDQIRTVDLGRFAQSCASPVMAHELNSAGSGDLSPAFHPLTPEENQALVGQSLSDFELSYPGIVEAAAGFPMSFSCESP